MDRAGMKRLLLLSLLLAAACNPQRQDIMTAPEEDYLYSLTVQCDQDGTFFNGWYITMQWWRDGEVVDSYLINPLPKQAIPTVFNLAAGHDDTYTYGVVRARDGTVLWEGNVPWAWNQYLSVAHITVPFRAWMAKVPGFARIEGAESPTKGE